MLDVRGARDGMVSFGDEGRRGYESRGGGVYSIVKSM